MNRLVRLPAPRSPNKGALAVGHMSLLDMINYTVKALCTLLLHLAAEERRAHDNVESGASWSTKLADRMAIDGWLQFTSREATTLELGSVHHRVALFRQRMRQDMQWADYAAEVRALREAIEGELAFVRLYHYPKARAQFYLEMPKAWEKVTTAFPSIKLEAISGVDCYALGHTTACVFHMMRVAEAGLRAIAAERKIKTVRRSTPVEWGTWNDVISAIDDALRSIRQKPAGPKKDAALAFYNSALSDLRALQDLYRNKTMHLRDNYDDGQAQSAMIRVRSLMDTLADRISEQRARPIRWGV